jgi:hypothetical protein
MTGGRPFPAASFPALLAALLFAPAAVPEPAPDPPASEAEPPAPEPIRFRQVREWTHQDHGDELAVSDVAFSPAGRFVLSGGRNGIAALWSMADNRRTATFPGHQARILAVGFTPDGRRALSAASDGTATRWDVESGRAVGTVKIEAKRVFASDISPDGRFVVSVTDRRQLELQNLETGEAFGFRPAPPTLGTVVFGPAGRLALSGHLCRPWFALWDVDDGSMPWVVTLRPAGRARSLAFSPDGRSALTGSWKGSVTVWDVASAREKRVLEGVAEGINRVAFAPDGRCVAAGSYKGPLVLWDAETGRRLGSWNDGCSGIRSMAFSPGGRFLAVGTSSGAVLILRIEREDEGTASSTAGRGRVDAALRDLASADWDRWARARNVLAELGDGAVDALLKAHPPGEPPAPLTAAEKDRILWDLDDSDFEVRARAVRELARQGPQIAAWLDAQLLGADLRPEVRVSLEAARADLDRPHLETGDPGRLRAVLVLLEMGGGPGVRRALAAYAASPLRVRSTWLARRRLKAR